MKLKLLFIVITCFYTNVMFSQGNVYKLLSSNKKGSSGTEFNPIEEEHKKQEKYIALSEENEKLKQIIKKQSIIIKNLKIENKRQKEIIDTMAQYIAVIEDDLNNLWGINKKLYKENIRLRKELLKSYQRQYADSLMSVYDNMEINRLRDQYDSKVLEYAQYPPNFLNGELQKSSIDKNAYVLYASFNSKNIKTYYENIGKNYDDIKIYARLQRLIVLDKKNRKISVDIKEIGNGKYITDEFTPKENSNIEIYFKADSRLRKCTVYPIIKFYAKYNDKNTDLSIIENLKIDM